MASVSTSVWRRFSSTTRVSSTRRWCAPNAAGRFAVSIARRFTGRPTHRARRPLLGQRPVDAQQAALVVVDVEANGHDDASEDRRPELAPLHHGDSGLLDQLAQARSSTSPRVSTR